MGFGDGTFGLCPRLLNRREVELSIEDYLDKCSDGPSWDAGSAERILRAIGDAMLVDVRMYPELISFSNNGTAPGNWPTEGRVENRVETPVRIFLSCARRIHSVECPSFGSG